MTFGQRLKILRIHKSPRLTQEDVALAIGAPRATYGNWETDRATPDFDYLTKLADYYQVTIDYLLDRKTSNEPANDFLDDFNSLSKEQQKMIKTMAKVMKAEQESDDDSTKNKVDFLDKG